MYAYFFSGDGFRMGEGVGGKGTRGDAYVDGQQSSTKFRVMGFMVALYKNHRLSLENFIHSEKTPIHGF